MAMLVMALATAPLSVVTGEPDAFVTVTWLKSVAYTAELSGLTATSVTANDAAEPIDTSAPPLIGAVMSDSRPRAAVPR